MNLNPKFQVQNQDFAFYPPRLSQTVYVSSEVLLKPVFRGAKNTNKQTNRAIINTD